MPLPTPITDFAPLIENRYVFEVSKHISMESLVATAAYESAAKIPGNISEQTIHLLENMLEGVLTEELRERRAWTYCIDVERQNFRHFYEFSIYCRALVPEAIDDVEKIIENHIALMGERKDLFEQTKQEALANSFMIDLTAKNLCDDAFDDLTNHQRIISLTELQNEIKTVTMDDLRRLLQWLQPERRWTYIRRP